MLGRLLCLSRKPVAVEPGWFLTRIEVKSKISVIVRSLWMGWQKGRKHGSEKKQVIELQKWRVTAKPTHGLMNSSKRNYVHTEKSNKSSNGELRSLKDVLKKDKTDGRRKRQNVKRGRNKTKDNIHTDFINSALAFHFHISHFLVSR